MGKNNLLLRFLCRGFLFLSAAERTVKKAHKSMMVELMQHCDWCHMLLCVCVCLRARQGHPQTTWPSFRINPLTSLFNVCHCLKWWHAIFKVFAAIEHNLFLEYHTSVDTVCFMHTFLWNWNEIKSFLTYPNFQTYHCRFHSIMNLFVLLFKHFIKKKNM